MDTVNATLAIADPKDIIAVDAVDAVDAFSAAIAAADAADAAYFAAITSYTAAHAAHFSPAAIAKYGSGPIVDAAAVEKTFSDAETRLFAIRGEVVRFATAPLGQLQVENPVVLEDALGKVIGSARLASDGVNSIYAEALFQYGCPERLSIEAGAKLYFHADMDQHFLYLDRAGLDKVRVPAEFVLPAGKTRVPFVVVSVWKLVLSEDPRVDANVSPVVACGEEEGA
jgi:hypothetical protein